MNDFEFTPNFPKDTYIYEVNNKETENTHK